MIDLDKLYKDFEKKLPQKCTLTPSEKQKMFKLFCSVSKVYFDSLEKEEKAIESSNKIW